MTRRTLANTLALAAIPAAGLAGAAAAQAAANSDDAAVRVPLNHYLQGHATGDGEHFRKAFHPDARMWGVRGGNLVNIPISQYMAGASGKPAPDEAQRKRWIDMVEVHGNTAIARLVLDYPSVKFVDHMTLLLVDGEWKIINKIFYAEPRP